MDLNTLLATFGDLYDVASKNEFEDSTKVYLGLI